MSEPYLSMLRSLPGVTSAVAAAIAARYPDLERLRAATVDDLRTIPCVTADVANRILGLAHADSPGEFSVADREALIDDLLSSRDGSVKICRTCGACLAPDTYGCPMCGARYTSAELSELPAVDTRPVLGAEVSSCVHCGAYLFDGAAACLICGHAAGPTEDLAKAQDEKGLGRDFLQRWQRVVGEDRLTADVGALDREEELRSVNKLLESDPNLEREWLQKGRILIALHRPREAIECFDRAGQLNPARDAAHRRELLEALGPIPDSTILPARWMPPHVSEAPPQTVETPPPVRVPRAMEGPRPEENAPKPLVLLSPREIATIRKALDQYDRLLAIDASQWAAWQRKGELLRRLGRSVEAAACFHKAAALKPSERELQPRAGRQTRAPPVGRRGMATRGGLTNGRVNGLTNGRVNGLTNGRVNGLTNGLRGRTKGLTNGLVNGLVSMRLGMTNGLTNGSGFTNGLVSSRFSREVALKRWKLYLIPLVSVVLLLLPLLTPGTDITSMYPIRIDGDASDWNPATIAIQASSPGGNPNVDVVRFGIADNVDYLAFLVEVEGAALRGGDVPPRVDSFYIFLDTDRDLATGYRVEPLGADRMIEVSGWQGTVSTSTLYEWGGNPDAHDWRGWTQGTSVGAVAKGGLLEAQIDWLALSPKKAPVYAALFARGFDGFVEEADYVLNSHGGSLLVLQEPIPASTLRFSNEPLLRLRLAAHGAVARLSGITVTLAGSAPFNAVGTLLLVDGDGGLVDERIPLGRRVSFRFPERQIASGSSVEFVVLARDLSGDGETLGAVVAGPSDIAVPDVAVAVKQLPSVRHVGYLGRVPINPWIDGGFAEWTAVTWDATEDVAGAPRSDLDLAAFAAQFSGSSSFFFTQVTGRLLAGTWVPELNALVPSAGQTGPTDQDRDTVPDALDPMPFDFNNDDIPDSQTGGDSDGDGVIDYGSIGGIDLWLNTTIPSTFPPPYAGRSVNVYIGPVERPLRSPYDILRVFVDLDNRSATGYAIAGLGADRLVEVGGTQGVVGAAQMFEFSGTYAGQWSWTPRSGASVALGFSRLEVGVPENLTMGDSQLYVEVGDSLGSWDAWGKDSRATRSGSSPSEAIGAVSSFQAAPLPLLGLSLASAGVEGERMRSTSSSPGTRAAPEPPQVFDISGNARYWLRGTNHATETACATNKVASTSQGPGPVQQVALSAGQDACWYADATSGTTIPAGSWETLVDISLSTYLAKAGAFNIGTGGAGTTVPVTGVGFQPKVVLYWWSGRTANTDSAGTANHQRGFGVGVSTTDRRAVCSQSRDNAANAVSDAAHRADAAICSLTTTGAIDGLADHSSMDANGFTLVIDANFATDLRIHYVALGGSLLTDVATGMFTEPGATGNQDVTGLSFQPDAVVLFSAMIGADPPGTAIDSTMMLGFAAGAGNPNDIIWASGGSNDGTGTMRTASYSRAGESIALFNAPITLTNGRAEVDAWLANGFSLNWNERAGSRRIHYLALKGGNYLVGDLLTQTSLTTIAETGFGFSPKGALFVSHNKAQSSADAVQAHDESSVGAFSSTTDRGGHCLIDEDAVPTSDVGTAVEHDELYCNLSTATAIEGLMDIQSVDSDGFTLVMDDADPAQSFVGYLAFGADITYDVYLQIWNKDTDAVSATIGSCLDVSAEGDDVQCLASGVASQTIASNEVVRIRIVHSGSVGTVSIDYDDADSTGDSRTTLPIPELPVLIIPLTTTLLVVIVAMRSASRRRERHPRSKPIDIPSFGDIGGPDRFGSRGSRVGAQARWPHT